MHKKQTIISLIAVMLLAAGSLKAQDSVSVTPTTRDYRGEITGSVYGPAAAGLPFSGDIDWKVTTGYSMGFGADYTHWFSKNIGIAAGLKITYLTGTQKSSAFTDDITGTLPVAGIGDQSVVVKASATEASELRTMTFIEIPVRLALEYNNIYCNLGVSLSLGVTSFSNYTFEGNSNALSEVTSMGIAMNPTMPLSVDNTTRGSVFGNGDLPFPVMGLIGGELGYRFCLDERNAISLGLFGRYGLLRYNPDGDGQAFRLANNKIEALQPSASSHVDKVGYYELGLRIAYHYGVRK